jgi:hypothetical protein
MVLLKGLAEISTRNLHNKEAQVCSWFHIRGERYRTEPDVGTYDIGLNKVESDIMSDIRLNFPTDLRYPTSESLEKRSLTRCECPHPYLWPCSCPCPGPCPRTMSLSMSMPVAMSKSMSTSIFYATRTWTWTEKETGTEGGQ